MWLNLNNSNDFVFKLFVYIFFPFKLYVLLNFLYLISRFLTSGNPDSWWRHRVAHKKKENSSL